MTGILSTSLRIVFGGVVVAQAIVRPFLPP
jgi:hypothetical protein